MVINLKEKDGLTSSIEETLLEKLNSKEPLTNKSLKQSVYNLCFQTKTESEACEDVLVTIKNDSKVKIFCDVTTGEFNFNDFVPGNAFGFSPFKELNFTVRKNSFTNQVVFNEFCKAFEKELKSEVVKTLLNLDNLKNEVVNELLKGENLDNPKSRKSLLTKLVRLVYESERRNTWPISFLPDDLASWLVLYPIFLQIHHKGFKGVEDILVRDVTQHFVGYKDSKVYGADHYLKVFQDNLCSRQMEILSHLLEISPRFYSLNKRGEEMQLLFADVTYKPVNVIRENWDSFLYPGK